MATPIVNRDGGFMWPGAVNRRRAFRTNPTRPNANNQSVSNRLARKQVVALRSADVVKPATRKVGRIINAIRAAVTQPLPIKGTATKRSLLLYKS